MRRSANINLINYIVEWTTTTSTLASNSIPVSVSGLETALKLSILRLILVVSIQVILAASSTSLGAAHKVRFCWIPMVIS